MLETERLILRPFADADVEEIYRLVYADPEVRMHWSSYKGTLEEFRERFKTDKVYNASESLHYFAVVRKANSVLLGLMGFQEHTEEDREWLYLPDGYREVASDSDWLDTELTYAFGRAYWGEGYATETGQVLIPYGFDWLCVGRIINAISPDNHRSRRLMIRLGFQFVDNGNPNDVIGVLENPAWPDLLG